MSALKSKSKINSVNNRVYKTPGGGSVAKKGFTRKASVEGLFLPQIYNDSDTN